MPIAAALSARPRSLLLVKVRARPAFFFRLVQAPGTHRLGQGVALHPQLIGNVGGFPTRVESLLGLGDDLGG
jgi:hypothetical protein